MAILRSPISQHLDSGQTGGMTARIGSAVTGLKGGLQGTAIDPLRSYVIFELLHVQGQETQVPQSTPSFPYMVLHSNPDNLEETYTKLVNRMVTRGGYVEQHWGEELDTLSCSGSTGAFVSIRTGLAALNRKASIAYRKHLELKSLYLNNGCVYDQRGNVVFHGGINLHFDGGIYRGYFESLTISEAGDSPYTFKVDFSYKVEQSMRTVGR